MKIIVSGGGTGGHIYPALAFIHELKKIHPDTQVLYIGTKKGLESKIVTREKIPFKAIEITGFKRSISLENVKTVMRFLKGVSTSKQIIKEFKPDVVIGTGGYVCGPVVYAASKMNIPTVIHEQNSVPGLTNKFLSRFVDKVAICFEEAASFFPKDKVVLTGNPRASEVSNIMSGDLKSIPEIDQHKKTVLIVGGSRGARPINDAFIEAMSEAIKKPYQFLYITGEVHYDEVMAEIKKFGNPENVIIKPFIHNLNELLSHMDLVVARAGATTLAEITALGLPSILIPSPYVTNNHQEKNARALSTHGAAILCLESNLNGKTLIEQIDQILMNDEKRESMIHSAKKLGIPDAAKRLYNVILSLNHASQKK